MDSALALIIGLLIIAAVFRSKSLALPKSVLIYFITASLISIILLITYQDWKSDVFALLSINHKTPSFMIKNKVRTFVYDVFPEDEANSFLRLPAEDLDKYRHETIFVVSKLSSAEFRKIVDFLGSAVVSSCWFCNDFTHYFIFAIVKASQEYAAFIFVLLLSNFAIQRVSISVALVLLAILSLIETLAVWLELEELNAIKCFVAKDCYLTSATLLVAFRRIGFTLIFLLLHAIQIKDQSLSVAREIASLSNAAFIIEEKLTIVAKNLKKK